MTLESNSINRSTSRNEIPEKLLEQSKSVVFVQNDAVVINIYLSLRRQFPHTFVYLYSDVRVATLVLQVKKLENLNLKKK